MRWEKHERWECTYGSCRDSCDDREDGDVNCHTGQEDENEERTEDGDENFDIVGKYDCGGNWNKNVDSGYGPFDAHDDDSEEEKEEVEFGRYENENEEYEEDDKEFCEVEE